MSSQILATAQLALTWSLMSRSALILNVTEDILRNVNVKSFLFYKIFKSHVTQNDELEYVAKAER